MRSSTLRSISTPPPRISRLTRLSTSLALCRATRNSRSAMLANGTMRICIRSRCSSRVRRACSTRSSVTASTLRLRFSWNEATSLTLSAIMRVSSCRRVKRSNSSGSNSRSLPTAMREAICDSACISTSRSWRRRRARLSENSDSEAPSTPTSFSILERVIDTSPAWFTRRSRMSARTRTSAAFGSAAGVSSMPGKGSKGCCSCSNRCSAWS